MPRQLATALDCPRISAQQCPSVRFATLRRDLKKSAETALSPINGELFPCVAGTASIVIKHLPRWPRRRGKVDNDLARELPRYNAPIGEKRWQHPRFSSLACPRKSSSTASTSPLKRPQQRSALSRTTSAACAATGVSMASSWAASGTSTRHPSESFSRVKRKRRHCAARARRNFLKRSAVAQIEVHVARRACAISRRRRCLR